MSKPEKTNEQQLVDLCFEIGVMIHTDKRLKKLSHEEIGQWIAKQLRDSWFDTTPVGSCWGVLTSHPAYISYGGVPYFSGLKKENTNEQEHKTNGP